MDGNQEPQKSEETRVVPVVDARDSAEAGEGVRKGDWQGYDPTLLTALLDD
jgi:hypothetical protein